MSGRPIYLDYQATTPVDPRVREAMLPFLDGKFGNPHSRGHSYGWEAAGAVREARSRVAGLIDADDDDIVFTSGATESCNLALRGVAKAAQGTRSRIITLATEHPAVFETVADLGSAGHEVVILPVKPDGLIDLSRLAAALDRPTLAVSIMTANNEIGVIQPVTEIGELCRKTGALFHTDATQAIGRMAVSVDAWSADLLSFSSHKVYGPKGIGALFVRPGTAIEPIMTGGGQEGGLRPGTLPTPLVAGFGAACELADAEGASDMQRMSALTRHLFTDLMATCPDLHVFGHSERRIPGSLCVGFSGINADSVVQGLAGTVSVSTGSACASATAEPSKVLLALGFDPEVAATGVRISLGRFTTAEEIEVAAEAISELIQANVF